MTQTAAAHAHATRAAAGGRSRAVRGVLALTESHDRDATGATCGIRRGPEHQRDPASCCPAGPCAGYVVKQKDGRRNRYQIQAHLPLPEPASQQPAIGEVLDVLVGDGLGHPR
jgi:hypothetical protein